MEISFILFQKIFDGSLNPTLTIFENQYRRTGKMNKTGVSMTGVVPVFKFDHFIRGLTIKYLRP